MRDAFSACTVNNGVINLGGTFTDSELKDIYFWFTEDLLNWNIPHWRVVGVMHSWDSHHGQSAFRRNNNYKQSIIELGVKLKYIIPNRIGGNNPEKGCFYGQAEEIENLKNFDRGFGYGPTAETRRANVLTEPSTVIGSLMIDNEFDGRVIRELMSDNAWFTQFSKIEEPDRPRFLIRDKFISELADDKEDAMIKPRTILFIKEGTGTLSYDESRKLFVEDWNKVSPVNVAYNLSEFFTCCYPDGDGPANTLKLTYWENIDEGVLTEILRNYGRRM